MNLSSFSSRITVVLLLGVMSCKKEQTDVLQPPPPVVPPPVVVTLKTADSIQHFRERPSGSAEATRLAQSFPHSDFDPTGFYLPPFVTLQVEVTPTAGTRLPTLLVGTYSRYKDKWNPTSVNLTAGLNTIMDPAGGILYIRFHNPAADGTCRIRFISGMKPIPYYQLGKTTASEWVAMVEQLNVPDVQLVGERCMITVGLQNARASKTEDMEALVRKADRVIRVEDSISGQFGTDPLDQPNAHRILLTESDHPDYYMAATFYRTWYRSTDAVSAILKAANLTWGPWHELGHMHQQGSWTWSELGEVTVNIYSIAVEKAFGVSPTRLTSQGEWTNAANYLSKPLSDKDFNASSVSVWVRLCMFQQLKLAYGDAFYHQLHRLARRDANRPNTTDTRMRWFMVNASRAAGRNLSAFFKAWGLKLSTTAATDAAYAEVEALGLPAPAQDITVLKD
jgi:Peptidase M60, enhancin and enhancin-like/N-terminal domain of M60-like peptidases